VIKSSISKARQHKYYNDSVYWIKHISITSLSQIIIQAIAFISGIIIIRWLPTNEYAIYTLGNALLGTMVVIANAGISTGVMAEGGKVWQDREQLGSVLTTGFELRKYFSLIVLIFAVPFLGYLLLKNNASYSSTILITIGLVPSFYASLSNALLVIAPKLHQDILPLQKNEVYVNFTRLILVCLSMFFVPMAYVIILASSVAQVLGNFRLRRIVVKRVDLKQKASPIVRKNILGIVKRILPDAIYYSLSGQITIWLLSIFGSTTSIAEIGALSRLALLLSIIPILFSILIAPRFARAISNYKKLVNIYVSVHIFLGMFLFVLVMLVVLFSREILWVLGENYRHLDNEIVLAIIGSALNVFAGTIYSLYSSRGWILNPILYISANIVTLIISITCINVSTLQGVLWLNIIVGIMQLLLHSVYGFYELLKLREVKVV
jgi:O-antigen/teichoic acid export membrane protein